MSFQPPPRIKNALDNRKLNLSAPCPGADGKYASLIWGLYANNPRITVYTNDPNDVGESKGYGKISANLDLPIFFMFLAKLQEVIDADVTNVEGGIKFKIENKNYIFPGGKRSEKPVVVSELWFGKDANGIIWISVTARDRPKIKFTFAPSNFHHFANADGTPMGADKVSALFASGYIRILENMMTQLAVSNYVEPPKKDNNGGGNRSNSNRGGNSGSSDTSNFEEDIPF